MTLLIQMPIYFHLSKPALKSLLLKVNVNQVVVNLKGIELPPHIYTEWITNTKWTLLELHYFSTQLCM